MTRFSWKKAFERVFQKVPPHINAPKNAMERDINDVNDYMVKTFKRAKEEPHQMNHFSKLLLVAFYRHACEAGMLWAQKGGVKSDKEISVEIEKAAQYVRLSDIIKIEWMLLEARLK